jgi:hypothetical protein
MITVDHGSNQPSHTVEQWQTAQCSINSTSIIIKLRHCVSSATAIVEVR